MATEEDQRRGKVIAIAHASIATAAAIQEAFNSWPRFNVVPAQSFPITFTPTKPLLYIDPQP